MTSSVPQQVHGPCFDLDQGAAYRIWREQKLDDSPADLDELVVEVNDPRMLSRAEHEAILQRCRKANMLLYSRSLANEFDRSIPLQGRQLGLERMDHNWPIPTA